MFEFLPHEAHKRDSITKISGLGFYREIADVCCANTTENRKTLCEKIHKFCVQCGGTYIKH